jgi:hypothetical protein
VTEQVFAEHVPLAADDAGTPAPPTQAPLGLAALPRETEDAEAPGYGPKAADTAADAHLTGTTAAEPARAEPVVNPIAEDAAGTSLATAAGAAMAEAEVAEVTDTEPPPIPVEGAADVIAAFMLVLGRHPSPPSVFETMLSMNLTGMLHRISSGAEFRDRVAAALLSEEPLPHERSHRSHALQLMEWLATRFELSPGRRARMSRVRSWRELLGVLVHDSALAPRIFAPSILPTLLELPAPSIALIAVEERAEGEEALRATEVEAAATERSAPPTASEPPPLPEFALERLTAKLDVEDAAALLVLVLGRIEHKPVTIGAGNRLGSSLFKLVHSGDFDERILASMIAHQRVPHDMEHPRPERALVRWAAERLPLSEASVSAVLAAETYYELLLALLADPLFVDAAFPVVLEGPKMLYLRHRVAMAVAARERRKDPAMPMLHAITFIPEPPTLTGLVEGILTSDTPVVRALLDGPEAIELPGRVLRQGNQAAIEIELPLAVLDGKNWFARLTLADGARTLLGARRFVFRAGQRVALPLPPAQPAPPPAPTAAILGVAGRILVASVPLAQDPTAVRLSIAGDTLTPAAIAAPAAETLDASAHLAFVAPIGISAEPALLVAPDVNGLSAPLCEPVLCSTHDAPLTELFIGPGPALEGRDTDPAALEAGRSFTLEIDGVPQHGRAPALSTDPLLAPFAAATRFAFALPHATFDGGPHELVVHAVAGEVRREVGRLIFAFDTAIFSALLGQAAGEAQRTGLLELAADLGRLDLLSDALAESVLDEGETLQPTKTLSLLLKAFARCPVESLDHPLRRLFELLWRQTAGNAAEADTLFGHLVEVLMRAGDADERRVLSNTRLKDAAVDFLLARWKRDPKGTHAARIAGPLLTLCRPGLAEMVIADGLKAAPANLDLLTIQARLMLLRGEFGGAAHTVAEVLASKPDHPEALSLCARLLQAEGDHLGAIAMATGRRGVSAVSSSGAPEMRHARQALPLGWLHWARRAFDADPDGEMARKIDAAIALQGGPVPEAERGFSVLYLPPQLRKGGYRNDFTVYGPDCLMVTLLEDGKLGGAPVIGQWALFLAADRRLSPQVIDALLAERRPAVGVVRLLQFGKSDPVLSGLLLRAEHVAELGEADLAQSDALLRDRLRAVTLFMVG